MMFEYKGGGGGERGCKMALYRSPDYQTSSKASNLSFQEKKFNIDFQDGGHLGFPITIRI